MSLIAWKVSRRRRKRKILFVWLWPFAAVFGLVLLALLHSAQRSRLQDSTVSSDGPQQSLSSSSVSLPPSIQRHCHMYRSGIVTGSLCAPLCDDGYIDDVIATFGNAHKEVMVTQCHDFCSEGQSIKAVLKHDEISAAEDGYEKEYSRMSISSMGYNATWRKAFQKLLQHHLPVRHALKLSGSIFRDMEMEYSAILNQTLPFAVQNSLTLLFRQKEYVLFQAYRNKGIFPKVYGTCGPLYLVEYCDPLLNQRSSILKTLLFNAEALQQRAANDNDGEGNATPLMLNSQHVISFGNPSFSNEHEKQPTESLSFVSSVYKFVMGETYEGRSKGPSTRKHFSSGNHVKIEGRDLVQTALSNGITGPYSGSQRVSVLDLDPSGDHKFSTRPSWSERAKAATKILRFLEHLEHEDTFQEHVHLCDPKLEHFAVGRDDGRVKLIDADLVLFDVDLATDADSGKAGLGGSCVEHEDCSDVMCRGWCRKETGRCHEVQINNNLQGICENVFLHPSLEYGAFFVDIPPLVYDDVTKALCDCATSVTLKDDIPLQKPSAATRAKVVDVLEASVLSASHDPVTKNQADKGAEFLFENCRLLHTV